MFAVVEWTSLEIFKQAYEFSFASPQSKILSISCRRFNDITENKETHFYSDLSFPVIEKKDALVGIPFS